MDEKLLSHVAELLCQSDSKHSAAESFGNVSSETVAIFTGFGSGSTLTTELKFDYYRTSATNLEKISFFFFIK